MNTKGINSSFEEAERMALRRRNRAIRLACLGAVQLVIQGPRRSVAQPSGEEAGSHVVGVQISAVHPGDADAAEISIRTRGQTYNVRDEKYSIAWGGAVNVYNSYNSYGGAFPHSYYLSPDHRWLFVTRQGGADLMFGYAYRLDNRSVVACRFRNGARLDEAAWQFTSKKLGISATVSIPGSGGETFFRHEIDFVKWARDSRYLEIYLITGELSPKLEPAEKIVLICDMKRRSFRIVSVMK
jgi:hypothetical protein